MFYVILRLYSSVNSILHTFFFHEGPFPSWSEFMFNWVWRCFMCSRVVSTKPAENKIDVWILQNECRKAKNKNWISWLIKTKRKNQSKLKQKKRTKKNVQLVPTGKRTKTRVNHVTIGFGIDPDWLKKKKKTAWLIWLARERWSVNRRKAVHETNRDEYNLDMVSYPHLAKLQF